MEPNQEINRRELLEFITGLGVLSLGFSTGCPQLWSQVHHDRVSIGFKPVKPTFDDKLTLAPGFQFEILMSWNEVINKQGDRFGFNNDFIAWLPLKQRHRYLMMVNHEYTDPLFVYAKKPVTQMEQLTRDDVDVQQKAVGVSLVEIEYRAHSGKWHVVRDSRYNRRIDATTRIPFSAGVKVAGHGFARGTLSNCSGGVTPWQTFLSCEENFYHYYGMSSASQKTDDIRWQWARFYPYPPEHYGWVVEVDPLTGHAVKHISLGRFAHEGALVVPLKDGRVVVYMGDDDEHECLYKFVSSKPKRLDQGELFVAQIESGRWLSLDLAKSKVLQKHFKNQEEVLINTRQAARIVGASQLDRPEGIARHPHTGAVFVSLTNNFAKKNYFGSLLKIEEEGGHPDAVTFKASSFLAGGPTTGFACPDNIIFDKRGGLWMTTDMSASVMSPKNKEFSIFGNNGLFYIPTTGPQAGQALRVATGPRGAELTGPCLAPDGQTLFLSVQHPGEGASRHPFLESHWPHQDKSRPAQSSVVAISLPKYFHDG